MIRTSLSPNVLKAGFRANVIPSEAEAIIDIRALPDENLTEFIEGLRKVIADPQVEIRPTFGRPAAPASNLKTEMFAALEVGGEKTLNQRHCVAPRLRPSGQPMGLEGIGAEGNLLEGVFEAIRTAGSTHAIENFLDLLAATEFTQQKRQIGFAFGRRIGIQEKRLPNLAALEIRKLPAHLRERGFEAARADETPGTDDVGNDFDGKHGKISPLSKNKRGK